MNLKHTKTKLFAGLALGLIGAVIPAQAAIVSINTGIDNSSNERGAAFNLVNLSATDTIQLTGVFQLPITNSSSITLDLWTRDGTVLNNIGNSATGWTSWGSATATGQSYDTPTFNLTTYTFSTTATIAPGATLGIFLKTSGNQQAYGYVASGSSSVTSADNLLQLNSVYGIGSMTSPIQSNAPSTFGPTRNFIGTVEYTVVPEPSVYAFMLAGALCGIVWLRRRKGE